jgi:hypothetical protein
MKKINVIAFGGLGGSLFSAGLKTILMRLNGIAQIDFKTFEDYKSWRRWGSTLASWKDDTVLIGHSFGVPAMFGAARMLGAKGPRIPLAISLDPSQYVWMQPALWGTGGNYAPDRILKVVNYWQTAPLFAIGNQRVYRDNGRETDITNFEIKNIIHGAVDDSPEVQALAVDAIKRVIVS